MIGAMECRAQNWSMSSIAVGLPVGDPETDFWPQDQAEGRDLQRIKDGANIMQTPFWSKRVEHAGYIQPSVHRRDNQVEAARNFLQRTIPLGVVDVVCAEFAGLGFLAVACGEGMDLAAPLVGEL